MKLKIFAREVGIFFLAGVLTFVLVGQQAQFGQRGTIHWTTGNVAADTATLTPTKMLGVLTGTPTAAANYTTPTAAQFCALFPFVATSNGTYDYDWVLKNTSAGANTITLVAGTGVTLSGTGTAAQNTVRVFKISLNNCTAGSEAVRIWSLATGAF